MIFINIGLIESVTKKIYLSISVVVDCFHFVLDPALWTRQYANDLVKIFVSIWILVLWSHQSTKVLHDDVNSLLMFGLTSQPSRFVSSRLVSCKALFMWRSSFGSFRAVQFQPLRHYLCVRVTPMESVWRVTTLLSKHIGVLHVWWGNLKIRTWFSFFRRGKGRHGVLFFSGQRLAEPARMLNPCGPSY